MTKINEKKQLLRFYGINYSISSNLLNLSLVKSSVYNLKSKQAKQNLDFIIDLTRYCPIKWNNNNIKIAVGAHKGFCGSFNKSINKSIDDNYYTIGKLSKTKKGKWSNNYLEEFSNITCKYHNKIDEVIELDMKSLWLPYEKTNMDVYLNARDLWTFLAKAFIDNAISQSIYSENKIRIVNMQTAKENTKKILDLNKKEYNKLRKQNVTNEILLNNIIVNR